MRIRLPLAAAVLLAATVPAVADVRLPGFVNDHMVLQRDMELPFWGWADAGEKVTLELAGNTVTTRAGADGRWRTALPAMKAGGPHTLTVKGHNAITVRDILVGEVWLCSGQSNMEFTVGGSVNAAGEIAAATDGQIRHVKVPRVPSPWPRDDIKASWQVCSPQTAGSFTACGYFMARELRRELKVPVGLINSSWGGTRIEPWTPPVGFASVPALKSIYDSVLARTPASPAYRKALERHIADVEAWLARAKAAKGGAPVEPSPAFPKELVPPESHQSPVMLYNGMIHALVGTPMRGVIWYQGESNHGEGMLYAEKKKALVGGWRRLWGIGDFPFFFVQIAPFQYGQEAPFVLPSFWEAQSACLKIPGTGMVVTNDIATLKNIHPPNKQDVGKRLALLALHRVHGRDVEDSGPTFTSMKAEGNRLRVTFDHAAGLKSRDGKPLDSFEIIGSESDWEKAAVEIDGASVLLSSPKVPDPAAVRFAWHKLATPNLCNGAGLPAAAFRSGKIPQPDFLGSIKEVADYALVYDLNLERLGKAPRYDVDRRKELGPAAFDRIAYLLELRPAGERSRYVFVSMDAFTGDLGKIGIPTVASGASFQRKVTGMNVVSNVDAIKTGTGLEGNIEFWPNNYGPQNAKGVSGASNDLFDFGDVIGQPVDGYGSMQVHHPGAGRTLFAVNHWPAGGPSCDLGIGNSGGKTRDWTFSANGGSFLSKRLRVFVRVKK